MKRTPARIAFVLAALAGLAFVAWRLAEPDDGPTRRAEATSETGAAAEHSPALADAELAATDASARDELRADAAAAASLADASTAELAANAAGPVSVRLVVEDDPWLPRDWIGNVRWYDGVERVLAFDVIDGRFELPRAPRDVAEFRGIVVGPFVALAVELTPPDVSDANGTAKPFELSARLAPGATLVFAESVPHEDRTAVDVGIGGWTRPGAQTRVVIGSGKPPQRNELELPHELPALARSTGVWVGGNGWAWRTFAIEPDSTRIEVVLQRAATLRVLHDGVVGAHVVAQEAVVGGDSRATISGPEPVELAGLSPVAHVVRLTDKKGEPLSRDVAVELAAGVTTEVDLRTSATAGLQGAARIEVLQGDANNFTLDFTSKLVLARLDESGEGKPLRRSPKLVELFAGGALFEASDLEPGSYRVHVEPSTATAEFDVVAGETASVRVDARAVGRVEFVVPEAQRTTSLFPTLTRIDPNGGSDQRFLVDFTEPSDGAAAYTVSLVPGTYRASVHVFGAGDDDTTKLESDTFVVEAGATVVVPLRAQQLATIEFAAVDSATGAPIALDVEFWIGVELRDATSNADCRGLVAFVGEFTAPTGSRVTLAAPSERLVVTLPEHAFWMFEPIGTIDVAPGAVFTLLGTAK